MDDTTSPDRFDAQRIALLAARGRLGLGLAAVVFPGLVARAMLTDDVSAGTRALGRLVGIRDFVIGAATVMSIKDGSRPENWVGMSALIDMADGVVSLVSPGASRRARLVGVPLAFASGALHLRLARALADASLDEERARLEGPSSEADADDAS
ncbi:MAG: hypothetical protein R3A49_09760 [Acidimicrobiia bacterium]